MPLLVSSSLCAARPDWSYSVTVCIMVGPATFIVFVYKLKLHYILYCIISVISDVCIVNVFLVLPRFFALFNVLSTFFLFLKRSLKIPLRISSSTLKPQKPISWPIDFVMKVAGWMVSLTAASRDVDHGRGSLSVCLCVCLFVDWVEWWRLVRVSRPCSSFTQYLGDTSIVLTELILDDDIAGRERQTDGQTVDERRCVSRTHRGVTSPCHVSQTDHCWPLLTLVSTTYWPLIDVRTTSHNKAVSEEPGWTWQRTRSAVARPAMRPSSVRLSVRLSVVRSSHGKQTTHGNFNASHNRLVD